MNLSMLKQAMELRSKLARAQKELAKLTFEVDGGKGAIHITINGQQKLLAIKIDPAVVNPDKTGALEEMLLKTVNDAHDKSKEAASKQLSSLVGDVNLPGLT